MSKCGDMSVFSWMLAMPYLYIVEGKTEAVRKQNPYVAGDMPGDASERPDTHTGSQQGLGAGWLGWGRCKGREFTLCSHSGEPAIPIKPGGWESHIQQSLILA